MKYIKSLLIFNTILFLPLFLIDSIYATALDKAQTSKSGIVDMFEVLPEYLQVNSTAENRDFHIKRNERAIGSGTQYYFYFEGGTLTVSMTTDGIFRIGSAIIGTSSSGNASYPISLSGTETTGVLPENKGGFGTSTPKYVRQNDGSSTTQLATNITIAGTGTDTATMNTNGVNISPTEKSYLDGLTSNIQTQINTLGTSTPTANSIVRTGSGTTTIESEWIPNTIILNNLTQITTRNYDDVFGTSTIKPTQIAIGTTTLQGALNAVGSATFSGTVTASGFSGNGSQLTGISATVAFSVVTGSASASQLPLISGLLGSTTSAQLPTVLKLYGTTTEQAAGVFGQWYMQSSSGSDSETSTKLLLHMDNPGTSTFVDSSASAKTVTAAGGAIGTTTAKFGSGGGEFNGTDAYLSVADNNDFYLGESNNPFTIDFWVKFSGTPSSPKLLAQRNGGVNLWNIAWVSNTIEFTAINSWATYSIDFTAPLTPVVGTWYHIAVVRVNTDNAETAYRIFVDGVSQVLTLVDGAWNGTLPDVATPLTIGRNGDLSADYLYGGIDELRISKGIARWTTNFTPPTAAYSPEQYTQYSVKYLDPVNGNTVFEILTPGTVTSKASYIYNNATTTVWGLGTNTAITGTTSGAYAGWSNRPIRVTGLDIGSSKEIKDNIKTIKIKPDLLDAEGMAKQNYIEGAKAAWIAANQGIYTTVVNETGTGSVTYIDTASMDADYANYAEGRWVEDLNKDTYAKNIQKTYEKGFWQMFDSVTPRSWNPKGSPNTIRKGFVVEDMPDVVKGEDKQSIDIGAMIAYMALVQQTLKADTIFALSTLKELMTTGKVTQQKIDYCNDRLEVLSP